jgi:hypothetical protein
MLISRLTKPSRSSQGQSHVHAAHREPRLTADQSLHLQYTRMGAQFHGTSRLSGRKRVSINLHRTAWSLTLASPDIGITKILSVNRTQSFPVALSSASLACYGARCRCSTNGTRCTKRLLTSSWHTRPSSRFVEQLSSTMPVIRSMVYKRVVISINISAVRPRQGLEELCRMGISQRKDKPE